MKSYLALLRGINVGGKNIIKMSELLNFFQTLGFTAVRTYIQSGNVIFCANEPDQSKLERLLEGALSGSFNYSSRVVIRSQKELQGIVKHRPRGYGLHPETHRYDVIFLKSPLSAAQAMKSITTRAGVDNVRAGEGVLYTSRLISRATQSHISRIVALPIYQDMTIRNWNTTTKLLQMMNEVGT